jgi:peptidyl-prolyl cis-trans isomerase C
VIRIPLLLLAVALVLVSCGQTRAPDATAATITGLGGPPAEIPRAELDAVADAVAASDTFVDAVWDGTIPPAFRQTLLTQLIQTEAMAVLVAEGGGSVTEEDRAEVRGMLEAELGELLAQRGAADQASRVLGEVGPYTELLVERNAHLTALGRVLTGGQEPGPGDLACVRHILVEDEALARDLVAQLEGGADFAAVALEHSIDVGSGQRGGDLGCSPSNRWVPEFADAVDAAPVGEVVGPVQSQFGHHLIVVYDRRIDTSGLSAQAITERLRAAQVAVAADLGRWDGDGLVVVPA